MCRGNVLCVGWALCQLVGGGRDKSRDRAAGEDGN